jgi:TetR/AcrR family transcriptional repressor of bet genes
MGRPSLREKRRADLVAAFVRVLAEHGHAGASVAAVAAAAGVAPGLIHHHFADKRDLYTALLEALVQRFRAREAEEGQGSVESYVNAALAVGAKADQAAARAWVSVFAQALSEPVLFEKLRRVLDTEIIHVQQRARGELSVDDASAVVAFVMGALVFGAFAPKRTVGFAAPALRRFLDALKKSR